MSASRQAEAPAREDYFQWVLLHPQGEVRLCLCPVWIIFFSWAKLCFSPLKGRKSGVWVAAGKAFKPFCFEHQTACLKICSEESEQRVENALTQAEAAGVRWVTHKSAWRGRAAGADKKNSPSLMVTSNATQTRLDSDSSDMQDVEFPRCLNESLNELVAHQVVHRVVTRSGSAVLRFSLQTNLRTWDT